MLLFKSRAKRRQVTEFLEEIRRDEVSAAERRREHREKISLAVAVIPVLDGEPQPAEAIATFTGDMSRGGVSLMMNRNWEATENIIGFSTATGMTFLRGTVAYRRSKVMGCFLLGVRLTEFVEPADMPALNDLHLPLIENADGIPKFQLDGASVD